MHEVLKTAFSDNTKGRTQTFEWFLDSDVGKFRLKTVSVLVIPPWVTQTKNMEKALKIVSEDRCGAIQR
jgi:hypothetical protein